MALDHPVIAIDGYSSCGKSTVARAIARILGIRYIDSGAMYRAVTLFFLRNQIPIPPAGVHTEYNYQPELDRIHISFHVNAGTGESEIMMNGEIIESAIRSMEVSENVSHVSAIGDVRHRLVDLQKKMKQGGGLVMDGRDIGTTVFPDADLKIFMTADPEVRAKRRFKELVEKGIDITLSDVRENVNSRDYEDSHREESPLRMADDAILLDNTRMGYDEQVEFVLDKLKQLTTAGARKD